MRFAGFLRVSDPFLETFREPCSSLHQGEEQPDIRETHNLYIESTRGSLKNKYGLCITILEKLINL